MLEHLRGLWVFAEVVDARSFVRAAERLGMTRSAVSKHVAQLEAQLGVQLLARTTRKLSLTEVGEGVYAAAVAMRESVERAHDAAHSHQGVVAGTLRVTAPVGLGRAYLVPLARELLSQHPRLELALVLSDGYLDLLDERIDVALRVGSFVDSSLVAARVAPVSIAFGASPSYLAQHGTPETPADLAHHQWIHHLPVADGGLMTLSKGKRAVSVRVAGRLACNDGTTCVEAAVRGMGVVSGPEFEISESVRAGRLVPVLRGWTTQGLALYAVSPPRRYVSSKVRTFIDVVRGRWRDPPWHIP